MISGRALWMKQWFQMLLWSRMLTLNITRKINLKTPTVSEVCITIEDRLFFAVNALIFLEWVLIHFIILQNMYWYLRIELKYLCWHEHKCTKHIIINCIINKVTIKITMSFEQNRKICFFLFFESSILSLVRFLIRISCTCQCGNGNTSRNHHTKFFFFFQEKWKFRLPSTRMGEYCNLFC